jgi:hypothetical protein
VVDHEFRDHVKTAPVSLPEKDPEVLEGAVGRMNPRVIRDVVPIILQRGRTEREQPDRRHPEIPEVVELAGQSLEITHPVPVTVAKGLDVDLVNDGILVP